MQPHSFRGAPSPSSAPEYGSPAYQADMIAILGRLLPLFDDPPALGDALDVELMTCPYPVRMLVGEVNRAMRAFKRSH